ncbi:MAG TPA: hypothetical protein VG323_10925 [Thermoanaerobaculia bacterium]|nr:hypothetical protein [Thermoanaerobaculia bacterium]
MMVSRWLVLALWAAAASAQHPLGPAKVHQIDIQIDSCAIRPDWIYLVLNDRVEKPAKLQTDGHWRWIVPEKDAIDFGVSAKAQVGVRFEGGRTRCRHRDAAFSADTANVGKATFSFPRCMPGFDVTLQIEFGQRGESPYRISYLRKVQEDKGDRLRSPCNEVLDFPASETQPFLGFVNHVDDLLISLYRPTRDPEGKLVPLNPLIKPTRLAKREEKAGPDEVAILWANKELKERANLTPNEIDIDVQTLETIHFKSLKLTFGQTK